MPPLDADLVARCVALTPASVLRSLPGIAGPPDDLDASPAVTVYLSAGHVLTGRLVRIGTDRGHDVVVLACSDSPDDRPDRLAYMEVTQVVAVAVHSPAAARDVLSGGALPPAGTGDPVTRLGLQRDYPASDEFPLVIDWASVPDSASALANLDRLLGALRRAASIAHATARGVLAWGRVSAIRLEQRPGLALSIQPSVDGLTVVVDLAAALPVQLDEYVANQISAAL